MSKVLNIVYRTISSHLIQHAGLTRATAQTGAVTLIQRFGSALNLNVHLHMLVLDGVYETSADPAIAPVFRRVPALTGVQLHAALTSHAERPGQAACQSTQSLSDPQRGT